MTEEKLLKLVKKYGNSGGVYVPSSWIGGNVEIRLVKSSPNPAKDIVDALSGHMQHIMGVFAYGSYARGEQEDGSDIDIVVVSDEHLKKIDIPLSFKKMGYDLNIISVDNAEKAASKDALFRMLLDEAKPIINHKMLEQLKSEKIRGTNLKFRLEFADSALNINKQLRELGSTSELVYSLVMRIKEMLLIRCFLGNRKYSSRMLNAFLEPRGIRGKELSNTIRIYRDARSGGKLPEHGISGDTADRLISALEELLKENVSKQKAKEKHRIHRQAD